VRGSVFQLKNKKWRGVVYVEKISGDKWKKKYFCEGSEKETQRKVNDFIYEVEHNLYADPGKITCESYFNEWFEIYKNKIEQNTAEYYRNMLDKHIMPGIGKIKLRDLKPADLDKFYIGLNKNKRAPITRPDGKLDTVKLLGWNTIRKIHSIIRNAINYAVHNNRIKANPADFVDLQKKEKYSPSIMDEACFIFLLNKVEGKPDEIPVLLAACTGLRRGEVFGLQWKDIDFNKGIISIQRVVTRYSKYVTKKPKNQSSQRFFAVPKFVMDALLKHKSTLKIIPEKVCSGFTAQAYSEHFKRLLEKYELPHIRYHDLRHFNAVIMLKYGVKDKTAAHRLGHAQVSTTTDIYQHVLSDMDIEAAKIINNVFSKEKA
jgi:integrase